ncbi:MAG: hypothetical protein PHI12_13220 [Dehalococcoidales bacterium]|nr:hypothetical protein [Dehalococcoidales bacterium]
MSKQNKMRVCLLNEVNEAKEYKLDAYKSHIESTKTLEAWGLNSRQQCIDEETGEYLQFIDPKDYRPIKIYESMDGDKDVEGAVTTIANEAEDEEMTLLDTEEREDGRLLWIGIALAGVILVFLIAVLMVFKNRTPEVVTAAVAVVPFIKSFLHLNGKSKTQKLNFKKLYADANAMIVVERTKKRIFRKIPEKLIPVDSFKQNYEGRWLHILGLDLKKKFWTIAAHISMEEGKSPLDLWIAKHCAEEVRETYGLSSSWGQKIKLGVFVGLIIGIIIVTFFIVTASSGGTAA